MDRRAWQAMVQGVSQSRAQMEQLGAHTSSLFFCLEDPPAFKLLPVKTCQYSQFQAPPLSHNKLFLITLTAK